MKYKITINSANTVDEVEEYWSATDYVKLLQLFNYNNSEEASKETLRELLLMAITDYEPNEAAAIILEYKLANKLTPGQIKQVSNIMLLDKVSEEYPDISLHSTLFHINQLLYKAFNGKFLSTKATIVHLTINPEGKTDTELTKAGIIILMDRGLSESNLIKRLFGDQMSGAKPFSEAESIIWNLKITGNNTYELLTSNYWMSKDDLIADEFEGVYEVVNAVEEIH